MAASPAELAATCELPRQEVVYRQSSPWSLTCGRCDCQPLTCRKRHASMPISARAFLQCYCEAYPERDTRINSHDRRVEKLSPAPLSGAAGSFLQPWVSVAAGSSPVRNSRSSPPLSVHRRRAISCGEPFDLWERANAGRTSEIDVLRH